MFLRLNGEIPLNQLKPFTYPNLEDLKALNYKSVCLGSYIPWNPKKQSEIIMQELGWRGDEVENVPPEYNYEKIECYMQGVRDYIKYIKRGYSRPSHLSAIDLRNKEISIEEAKENIKLYEGKKPPSLDIFLEFIGLKEDEFYEVLKTHEISPHKFDVKNIVNGKKLHDFDTWETSGKMNREEALKILKDWKKIINMLKKRIIPKFLFQFRNINGTLLPTFVISKKFSELRIQGSIIPQAKIYEAQLADEIIILNIEDKQCSKDNEFLSFLKKFSEQIFMPLTVGGGVKTLECFEKFLNNGADKVFINSEAINNPNLVKLAADKFGSQCVVLGIDFKEVERNKFIVFSKGGKINTNLDLIEWTKKCEDLGAGEIVMNDIERDGTSTGLNIEVAKKISEFLSIPLIFSGGCGLASHFVEGFKKLKQMLSQQQLFLQIKIKIFFN